MTCIVWVEKSQRLKAVGARPSRDVSQGERIAKQKPRDEGKKAIRRATARGYSKKNKTSSSGQAASVKPGGKEKKGARSTQFRGTPPQARGGCAAPKSPMESNWKHRAHREESEKVPSRGEKKIVQRIGALELEQVMVWVRERRRRICEWGRLLRGKRN